MNIYSFNTSHVQLMAGKLTMTGTLLWHSL